MAATLLCWACGAGREEPAGFSGGGGGGGADAGDASAAADTGFEWPDAPASTDADPGPAPGFDAAPDAPTKFECSGKTGARGRHDLRVQTTGLPRSSLLVVPDTYDPARGAPLVLNFHGFSSAGWQQEILTGMTSQAAPRGVIVAYPDGIVTSWNAGDCCGTAWVDAVDDVGFVRTLIDRVAQEWCVDPRRIYATGFSNGGFLSHRLACELSDRIAAIAPVSGVIGVEPATCVPPRAVPVLHIHGTSDPLVPYGGGTPVIPQLGVGLVFRSVADSMTHWRSRNACSGTPVGFFANGDTSCVEWPDCSGGVRTALCTVDAGGHTWPSGLPIPMGKTTRDLDATAAILDFFLSQPMPN